MTAGVERFGPPKRSMRRPARPAPAGRALSQRYAISSLDEARSYLADPVLGPRLEDCTRLVLAQQGRSLAHVLGPVDAQKFHSSMTLFARAAPEAPHFREALDAFFGGEEDEATIARLGLDRPG